MVSLDKGGGIPSQKPLHDCMSIFEVFLSHRGSLCNQLKPIKTICFNTDWMILGYPHDLEVSPPSHGESPPVVRGCLSQLWPRKSSVSHLFFPKPTKCGGCSGQEKRHPQKHRTQMQESVDSIDHEVDLPDHLILWPQQ